MAAHTCRLICDSTSPGFPRALAGVLHFRSSIVTVAFTALYTVAKDFSLPIRPAFNELSRFSYLGIAFPSTQFSTSEYMEQLQYYINLSNWGLFSSVVYVTSSTSNFHSVAEVSRYANKHFGSLTVLTHKKLLARQSTKYVTALERMSTEQREVIDYIMLENAAYFTSLTRNALALSVAVARAGRRTDDAAICGQLKRTRAWRDGWSELPAKDDDAPATFFWP